MKLFYTFDIGTKVFDFYNVSVMKETCDFCENKHFITVKGFDIFCPKCIEEYEILGRNSEGSIESVLFIITKDKVDVSYSMRGDNRYTRHWQENVFLSLSDFFEKKIYNDLRCIEIKPLDFGKEYFAVCKNYVSEVCPVCNGKLVVYNGEENIICENCNGSIYISDKPIEKKVFKGTLEGAYVTLKEGIEIDYRIESEESKKFALFSNKLFKTEAEAEKYLKENV